MINNKYIAFIFDFDFTLADASQAIIDCANYAFSQLGIEQKSDEAIRKTIGMTLLDCFRLLTGIEDDNLAKQFATIFMKKADEIMTDSTVLYKDTIEVLSILKGKNYYTAIVTSKLHRRIDDVLRKYNITELIDYIVGFEDVEAPKPSAEGLLKAIDFLKVNKDSVLYIGDSLIDANTAKNANVDFAAVLTGTTTAEELETLPHVCIMNSLSELMEQI